MTLRASTGANQGVRCLGSNVHVSDHAVVRYLERVLGIDVDGVRAEIAAKIRNPEKYARFLEGSTANVRTDGTVFVITAYSEEKPSKQRRRKKKHRTRHSGGAR